MLSKLFKQKSVPTNEGKDNVITLQKKQFSKAFEVELSNMQESPSYPLTNQLSIGSEIGNIVVADPSISPRHASFSLQDEVVSVLDHGSVAGTFINGKKIQPGKTVILEENDVVRLGDLEVTIKSKSVEVPLQEIPELPKEDTVEEKESVPELPPVKDQKKIKVKVPKKPALKEVKDNHSANAVLRVFSVMADFLIAYAILTIFSPFVEFQDFLQTVPQIFIDAYDWQSVWKSLEQDYGFITQTALDVYTLVSFDFIPLLITFALVRLVSTFLFGVSVSELFLGLRATGNKIWARVGGVIRVLIGFITGPFLIFDSPAIISKRTFKELITYTNVQVPSNFVSALGVIFYLPLLMAFVLFSPLIQGLEFPDSIVVNDMIAQRVKVNAPSTDVSTSTVSGKSKSLNVDLSYDKAELSIIPAFKFQGVKNKLRIFSSLIFYQRDQTRFAEIEIYKNFDMKQLLKVGIKGNTFLYEKYPSLYNFVYEADDSNPAFRKKINPKTQLDFASEFIKFTKNALGLNAETAFDLMQEETLLLKSLMDYKMSLLSLIEYKDFSEIGFLKIGNAVFMKISYSKQKPFDLIVPMIAGQGKIFKITYDKKESHDQVSSKLYKYNLHESNWFPDFHGLSNEITSPLQIFDLFVQGNVKLLDDGQIAQSIYGLYYEQSAEILKRNDSQEISIWKEKVSSLLQLLETLRAPQLGEGVENPRLKLIQNLRDLKDALENNNSDYFGIKEIQSV